MPEVGWIRRYGRARQVGQGYVLQVSFRPRVATRRLRRRMIVMGVVRKSARVHVMTRDAVRVQHTGKEKRGDHGFLLFCQALEPFCGRRPLQRSHGKPYASMGGFKHTRPESTGRLVAGCGSQGTLLSRKSRKNKDICLR